MVLELGCVILNKWYQSFIRSKEEFGFCAVVCCLYILGLISYVKMTSTRFEVAKFDGMGDFAL